ncbi:Clp protease N-terminal domain-containing protein [Rhodococcus sp. NPDC058521]|uniref:Clp protease N-terminal domain-containing protein n=1 Tax=Rhodococcus sp. NPDC058521 TaxID=3346536 RepID=UPI003659C3F4
MFERFTKGARAVVVDAQKQARTTKSPHIGPEHLVLGILAEPDGPAANVLAGAGVTLDAVVRKIDEGSGALNDGDAEALGSIGIDLDEVRRTVEDTFGEGALDDPMEPEKKGWFARRTGHIPFTKEAKKALELSLREAIARKDDNIGTEHILLGILRAANGVTRDVLEGEVDVTEIRRRLLVELDRAA